MRHHITENFQENDIFLYEQMGELSVILGKWSLVTFANMTELREEFNILRDNIRQLREMCIKQNFIFKSFPSQCNNIMKLLTKDLDKMEMNLENFNRFYALSN
jgi:hypothetical protein